jgi:maltose alpha-D-glucosyltransferase/alpha-amylase
VVKAVMRVMRFWLDMGVDGMRLDAVPYLVEREGTQCANLPETHAILRTIRRELDQRYHARMLLAEANQWPSDVRAYFGEGDECHMAFHFPLMPRLFMALRQEDRHPLSEILYQMPDIPDSCQWAIFLRNHDELTLEMVSDEERDYMYEAYAADPQMRLNVGIRRRLAPLMENSRTRIELMTALLMSLPGTPVVYYGDELGMGDNIYLGDRNGVRTPMQWSADRNAGFSRADPARLYAPPIMDSVYGYQAVNVEAQERSPHSLLNWMRRLIALRQRHVTTFGRGSMELLRPVNRTIFAFIRRAGTDDPILVVANLSRTVQGVTLDLARLAGLIPVEMSGSVELPRITDAPYFLTLGPNAFMWLRLQREPPGPLDGRPRPVVTVEPDPEQSPLLVGPEWPKLLDGSVRSLLERRYLPAFLRRQPWFDSRTAALQRVSILDWGALPGGPDPVFVMMLSAVPADGEERRFILPVAAASGDRAEEIVRQTPDAVLVRLAGARKGVLHARVDGAVGRLLTNLILSGREAALRHGRLRGALTSAPEAATLPPRVEELAPAPFDNERFASAATIGERVRLKLIRRLWRGPHPEVVIVAALVEARQDARLAPLLGTLDYVDADGVRSAAGLLNAFVPHQADGWRHALLELERYFDLVLSLDAPPAVAGTLPGQWTADVDPAARETVGGFLQVAATLGQRLAELHLALHASLAWTEGAGETSTTGDQLSERVSASWERARAALVSPLPEASRAAAADAVGWHDRVLAVIHEAGASLRDPVPLSRVHGAADLAHVLLHEGNLTFINLADDGTQPPERRLRLRSPFEDVARVLRSLDLAARASLTGRVAIAPHQADRLEGWMKWWAAQSAASFLSAYRGATVDAPWTLAPAAAVVTLLRLFMLEETFEEIRNRAAGNPAWLAVVLGGGGQVLN